MSVIPYLGAFEETKQKALLILKKIRSEADFWNFPKEEKEILKEYYYIHKNIESVAP